MGDCLATINMGRKLGAVPFWEGWAWPQCNSGLGWGLPSYQVVSWCIQPFGHNRYGLKIEGALPLLGELGPHLTQRRLGRGLPPYQVASWSIQPLATIDMGRKLGGSAPFWGRELGLHLTQCGLGWGIASFILIHPTVWPQYTNVTDRQTGQTDRQRSDSIGRTALQTVAQKSKRWYYFCYIYINCMELV